MSKRLIRFSLYLLLCGAITTVASCTVFIKYYLRNDTSGPISLKFHFSNGGVAAKDPFKMLYLEKIVDLNYNSSESFDKVSVLKIHNSSLAEAEIPAHASVYLFGLPNDRFSPVDTIFIARNGVNTDTLVWAKRRELFIAKKDFPAKLYNYYDVKSRF